MANANHRHIRDWAVVLVALVSVLLTTACGGAGGAPGGPSGATPTPLPAASVAGTPIPSASATATGSTSDTSDMSSTPVMSHGGPVKDQVSLIDELRKSFVGITPVDKVKQPFLSVEGDTVQLNSETIQVFEYADAGAAEQDAAKIAPNGEIAGTAVMWVAQPHFYRVGRIIVLYPGKDPTVLGALAAAVGKPFAVGLDVASPNAPPSATPTP